MATMMNIGGGSGAAPTLHAAYHWLDHTTNTNKEVSQTISSPTTGTLIIYLCTRDGGSGWESYVNVNETRVLTATWSGSESYGSTSIPINEGDTVYIHLSAQRTNGWATCGYCGYLAFVK